MGLHGLLTWPASVVIEEWRLLGCYAVWLLYQAIFQSKLSASIIRVTTISELGATVLVNSGVMPACT
jgi:hypothetical protein